MTELDLRMKAARIAGQAELKDVRTSGLHADMEFPPRPGDLLGYELASDFKYGLPEDPGDATVVVGEYSIPMWVEGEAAEKQQFATLSFTLVALFDIPIASPEEPYGEDEWEAFVQTSAQFALYPYAREVASMLSSRLGVPPLTLGVLRVGLSADEVAATGD